VKVGFPTLSPAQFLSDQGDIDSAMLRIGPSERKTKAGSSGELDVLSK
jgi:hypothetical protein